MVTLPRPLPIEKGAIEDSFCCALAPVASSNVIAMTKNFFMRLCYFRIYECKDTKKLL